MKGSHILAIIFWLMVFTTLLIEMVFNFHWATEDAYTFSSLLAFTSVIFFWFLVDARERDFSPSAVLKISVVAFSAIALPYYKFRYFGAHAGFAFLAIILFCFLSTIISAMVIEFLVYNPASRT